MNNKRVVFRCCNKRCKNVWVMEFDLDALIDGFWKYSNTRTKLDFYVRKFGKCPTCAYPVSKSDVIRGRKNDTPCDHRCTSAKGHDCDCSCGGENHGKAHQLAVSS